MRRSVIFVLIILILGITSCGTLKDKNALLRIAKDRHGDCEIVMYTETKDMHKARVRDTLQDFEYDITSSFSDITIDGSYFGTTESVGDDFERCLQERVIELSRGELDSALGSAAHFSDDTYDAEPFLVIFVNDEADAERLTLKAAEIINRQNMDHRLDEKSIYAVSTQSPEWFHNEHYGSVTLPEMRFLAPVDEKIEYFTEMAQMQTDPKAVFLRIEKGVFSDTGASLDKVVYTLGTDYPTEEGSPVTFYYFKDSHGDEYYLCDFNYYDEKGSFAWYTNYNDR